MIYLPIVFLGIIVLLSCFVAGYHFEQEDYGNCALLIDRTGFLPLPDEGLILAERTTLGAADADVDLRRLGVDELMAVIELRENDFYLLVLHEISEVDLRVSRGDTVLTPFGNKPLRLCHEDCLLVNYVPVLRFSHY